MERPARLTGAARFIRPARQGRGSAVYDTREFESSTTRIVRIRRSWKNYTIRENQTTFVSRETFSIVNSNIKIASWNNFVWDLRRIVSIMS